MLGKIPVAAFRIGRGVAPPPVTWRAGNGWVGFCITTTDKLPDLPVQK